MKRLLSLLLIVFLAGGIHLVADDDDYEDMTVHQFYIKDFKGTETCLKCHEKQAMDVFHSAHYQWKAGSPDLTDASQKNKHGKMLDINDFCTNPGASWIDMVRNDKGELIADGCSKCHIGFGKLPGEKLTRDELLNIDCLMCHAPGYTRKIVEENGSYKWIPKDDPELLTLKAQNVMKASAQMCLRCHAGAGGGTNFKRGDLESAHFEPEEDLDVHLANDMTCTECHTTENHRIAGRGNDLATTDLPGVKVACENCHEADPHSKKMLNRHAETLHCTVCHIPDFARVDATDMHRDWSHAHQHHNGKWEAVMEMKQNVIPEYRWWNGKTHYHDNDKPVHIENGIVGMAVPDGSIRDKDSKIYPFKRHTAMLPVLKKSNLLIPIRVNTIFGTGNIEKAVIEGAKHYRNIDITKDDFKWVKFERYMGLYHEVVNNDTVLKCSDCHVKEGKGRLDWETLGYEGDPRKTKKTKN